MPDEVSPTITARVFPAKCTSRIVIHPFHSSKRSTRGVKLISADEEPARRPGTIRKGRDCLKRIFSWRRPYHKNGGQLRRRPHDERRCERSSDTRSHRRLSNSPRRPKPLLASSTRLNGATHSPYVEHREDLAISPTSASVLLATTSRETIHQAPAAWSL